MYTQLSQIYWLDSLNSLPRGGSISGNPVICVFLSSLLRCECLSQEQALRREPLFGDNWTRRHTSGCFDSCYYWCQYLCLRSEDNYTQNTLCRRLNHGPAYVHCTRCHPRARIACWHMFRCGMSLCLHSSSQSKTEIATFQTFHPKLDVLQLSCTLWGFLHL